MSFNPYLYDVLVILIAAVVVVSLFRALKLSPIVGYLIAGLAIGPHALRFTTDTERIQLIGELGVVFLLFTIGLKMPLRRFQALRKYVFGLGFAQVFLTGGVLSLIAYFWGLSLPTAILIGTGLALSSTAVGLQLLSEQGELSQKYGRVSFGVLLSQDLAVVVLLTLLSTLTTPGLEPFDAFRSAGLKVVFVLTSIVLIGRLLLRPLFRLIAQLANAEIFIAVTILVVLLTSLATDAVDLSKELGAFLAGLLLSETEYRHQVEADIQPFYGLLLGLFFMTVGMGIDIHLLMSNANLILGILTSVLVVKTSIVFGLCLLFKIPVDAAFRSSFLLAAGGEFIFILLPPAADVGLLEKAQMQIIFLAVALSMALMPFLSQLSKFLSEEYLTQKSPTSIETSKREIDDLRDHVIIAGFGRVGQILSRLLSERLIPFVAIDSDMNRIAEGRSRNLPVFYGDATRDHVIKSLSADKAAAVAISLHNPKASLKTALMIRRKYPNLPIAVRLEDDGYEAKLAEANVIVIKPENLEPSLQLASTILKCLGTRDDDIVQSLDSFRSTYTPGRK